MCGKIKINWTTITSQHVHCEIENIKQNNLKICFQKKKDDKIYTYTRLVIEYS